MKRLPGLVLLFLLLSPALTANEFHPDFKLLDADGELVLLSGQPLSSRRTCGECHDVDFIHDSSDHADAGASAIGEGLPTHPWASGPGYFGGWDALTYERSQSPDGSVDKNAWLKHQGQRHVGGGPVADTVEMSCLLCHGDTGGQELRAQALAEGEFAWANSAALSGVGLISRVDNEWRWNPWSFLADGRLAEGLLSIRKPSDENCAQCHGQARGTLNEPLVIDDALERRNMTSRSGVIISPQKIRLSGLNVRGKESLNHAFDVHSDRVVGCVNCHYSLNNPVYFQQRRESQPAHLSFDPRRLTNADYLERPLHQFAKGQASRGLADSDSANTLRRCESCHDAEATHDWLPYRTGHFSALACESCHVPKLYGPAVESVDWSLPSSSGAPRISYRNVEGNPARADSLIKGFRPVLLARESQDGQYRLAPFNLVSSWYWLAGEPSAPVDKAQLLAVFYPGGDLHPNLADVLDVNADGQVEAQEMSLQTAESMAVAHTLLASKGLTGLKLSAEAVAYPVNHNVVNGRWATRECKTCHGRDSILATPFSLSGEAPANVLPVLAAIPGVAQSGQVVLRSDRSTALISNPGDEGFYVLGLNSVPLVDLAGLAMLIGVLLGVTGHGAARYIAWRRRPKTAHSTHPVKLYDAYDRIWHGLQALAILMLLFTGLVIHKPQLFGMFSFRYMVQVHNVLGFILLINAALALFYNLASGSIKRFLPEPRDFFARSFDQALYYMRGIFAGAQHPLEKTPENRLNPLQQMTYLAILNILLPAQVITGVLMWGLQRWPEIGHALGGLPVLAPLHTLLAWMFAAFIVMHVYLTTTGETPAAGIKSMISGWENVEDHEPGGPMIKDH